MDYQEVVEIRCGVDGIRRIPVSRTRAKGTVQVVEVLVAAAGGGFMFLLPFVLMRQRVAALEANLGALSDGVLRMLSGDNIRRFGSLRASAFETFNREVKGRFKKGLRILVLFGLIGFVLFLCIAHLFIDPANPFIALFPIPAMGASAFLCVIYFFRSAKGAHLVSSSASNPELWFGLILPSVRANGTLDIVMGSLNPGLMSCQWFLSALSWLRSNRGVQVRIVTSMPSFEQLAKEDLDKLRSLWDGIVQHRLDSGIRFLEHRPAQNFVVTNNIVFVEADHHPWYSRPKDTVVVNHTHIFDLTLNHGFRVKFNRMWSKMATVKELRFLEPRWEKNHDRREGL